MSATQLRAQSSKLTSPPADVLIFTDGEMLIGQFERSNGNSVVFKSNMAGEIAVDWSKIQTLRSAEKFAIAEKGVRFGRRRDFISKVPKGSLQMTDQTLHVTSSSAAPAQRVPVSQSNYVIDQPTFERALARPGVFEYWKGSASFGASLVLATQNDRSYTSSVALVRDIPGEPWMDPENRTIVNFSSSYGELTQPGQPRVKTSIYHASVERDEYFSPRLYVFAQGAFDHNFSQGLDLQETFGTGVGWTVLKNASQELDLRSDINYVHQQFQDSSQNQELIGSTFGQSYNHKSKHNVMFLEQLSFAPSWNNTRAYSATGSFTLTIPVFRRIGVTLGTLDTFLNNPSPGFRKNSFQFTTGLTYTLP